MLVLRLEGTEIERPLAVVMIGGLVTSTLFTLLALPAFYELAQRLASGRAHRGIMSAFARSEVGSSP